MKPQIIVLMAVVSTFAFAGNYVPADGAYKVTGGGLTQTTCPAEDTHSPASLPWWTVKNVGPKNINIRESVNPYSTYRPISTFGYFPLTGSGYGTYEGSGYVIRKEASVYGPCNMRRDIRAKVNVFGSDLVLEATVTESFVDPVFGPPACAKLDRVACQYSFRYDLSFADNL